MHDWMKSKAFIAIFRVMFDVIHWLSLIINFFSIALCSVFNVSKEHCTRPCPSCSSGGFLSHHTLSIQNNAKIFAFADSFLLVTAEDCLLYAMLRSAISPFCIKWWECKITSVKLLWQYHIVINFHKNK